MSVWIRVWIDFIHLLSFPLHSVGEPVFTARAAPETEARLPRTRGVIIFPDGLLRLTSAWCRMALFRKWTSMGTGSVVPG